MIPKLRITAWHVLLVLICGLVLFAVFALPPERSTRRWLYDTRADGARQIADALAEARIEHRRVLVQFGANWCKCCYEVHALFEKDPDISRALNDGFILALVDMDNTGPVARNTNVVSRYNVPIDQGVPQFIVLDKDGAQLTTKETGSLSMEDHHDPAKVLAFLQKWSPAAALRSDTTSSPAPR